MPVVSVARISHRRAAAARDAAALAAFSRLRVLQPTLAPSGPHAFGVAALTGGARGPYDLPSPTPRPSGRERHQRWHLPRFASRAREEYGLGSLFKLLLLAPFMVITFWGTFTSQAAASSEEEQETWRSKQHTSFSRDASFETEDVVYTLRSNNGYDLFVRSVRPKLSLYPDDEFPAVLKLAGGWGAMTHLLDDEFLKEAASNGIIFVAFDSPMRTDYPVGSSERDYKGFKDQDDVAEVLYHMFDNPNVNPNMVGVWSGSSGALLASGVLGRYPKFGKDVAFFIDGEGPHCVKELLDDPELDSNNIGGLQNWEKARDAKVGEGRDYETEEEFWVERCGYSFIGRYEGIYQRLQGRNDHALGYYYKHAIAYLNAATNGKARWTRLNKQPKNQIYQSDEEPDGTEMESVLDIESLMGNEAMAWNLFYDILEDIQEAHADNHEDSPFGFHPANVGIAGYPDNGFVDAENIGVRWHRPSRYAFWFLIQPDLNSTAYDFSRYDYQYSAVPQGINILANIAPENPGHPMGYMVQDSYQPVDEAAYAAFVRATVERYDGDGIGEEDFPGGVFPNPIRYWQVSNEPRPKLSGFAHLQRITYRAIKEACVECTVLIGGATGFPEGYVEAFDTEFAPILNELAGESVDVFDFHWYGTAFGDYRLRDATTGEDVLEHIRAALSANGFAPDLPIWITEMGTYSGNPAEPQHGYQSERDQARDLFKRFIYPLSLGIEKVFPAFGLIEGFKHNGGFFDHTGLIYDGEGAGDLGLGVKKLGYVTYRKMTEKLEGADWASLATLHDGTATDHVFLFRVNKDRLPVHIAWWDWFDEADFVPGDTRLVTISGLSCTEVIVTDLVPDFDTGLEAPDYASAFTVSRVPVVGGKAVVELGQGPVIIKSTCGLPATRRAGGRVVPADW